MSATAACQRHLSVLASSGSATQKARAASRLRDSSLFLDSATQSALIADVHKALEDYDKGLRRPIGGSIKRRLKRVEPLITSTHSMVQRLLELQEARVPQQIGASSGHPPGDAVTEIDVQIAQLRQQRKLAKNAAKKAAAAEAKSLKKQSGSRKKLASEGEEGSAAKCGAARKAPRTPKAKGAEANDSDLFVDLFGSEDAEDGVAVKDPYRNSMLEADPEVALLQVATRLGVPPEHLVIGTPPDGDCCFHCFTAWQLGAVWRRHRDAYGWCTKVEEAKIHTTLAKALRRRLIGLLLELGRPAEAERLELPGAAGYPGADELPYLAQLMECVVVEHDLQHSLQPAFEHVAPVAGTPISAGRIHIGYTVTQDGSPHWVLLRSHWPEEDAEPSGAADNMEEDV